MPIPVKWARGSVRQHWDAPGFGQSLGRLVWRPGRGDCLERGSPALFWWGFRLARGGFSRLWGV